MPELAFKAPNLMAQFNQLDPRVQGIALLVAFYFRKFWNYPAVVTSVYRSSQEQKQLRAKGAPAVANSPHEDWRAVDLRLNTFSHPMEELTKLVDLINFNFRREDGKPTVLVHGEGANVHLHIQVPKEKRF